MDIVVHVMHILTALIDQMIHNLAHPPVRGLFFFLIGGIAGSISNVLIYRLVAMSKADAISESIELYPTILPIINTSKIDFNIDLYRPSTTPCCARSIKWYHNIPILSWLALRGKCHYCSTSISRTYVIIELITATVFCFIALTLNSLTAVIITSSLMMILLVIGVIDFRHKFIPNSLNFSVLVLMIIAINENMLDATLYGGAAQAILVIFMLDLTNQFYVRKLGAPVIGGGDIKLLAAGATGLGITNVLLVLIAALISSYMYNQLNDRTGEQPLGQWIAGVLVICWFLQANL